MNASFIGFLLTGWASFIDRPRAVTAGWRSGRLYAEFACFSGHLAWSTPEEWPEGRAVLPGRVDLERADHDRWWHRGWRQKEMEGDDVDDYRCQQHQRQGHHQAREQQDPSGNFGTPE